MTVEAGAGSNVTDQNNGAGAQSNNEAGQSQGNENNNQGGGEAGENNEAGKDKNKDRPEANYKAELERLKDKLAKMERESEESKTKALKDANDFKTLYEQAEAKALKNYKVAKMAEAGLDSTFDEIINGNDETEIDTKIEKAKGYLNSLKTKIEKEVTDKFAAKGFATNGGSSSGKETNEDWNDEKLNSIDSIEDFKKVRDSIFKFYNKK